MVPRVAKAVEPEAPGGERETITETFSSPVPPMGPNALCGSCTACPKIWGGFADGAPGSSDVALACRFAFRAAIVASPR